MIGRAGFSSKCWRVLRWGRLGGGRACSVGLHVPDVEIHQIAPTATLTTTFTRRSTTSSHLLFVIDNSSSTTEMQSKLYDQLPSFMKLRGCRRPPNLHVAVVSSDMGAPGDSMRSIGCTAGR